MANGLWVPGQSGNPKRNGARPFGSRNRRTTEAIEAIINAGHQDPLLTLAELQAKSADEGIRATAANMLAPFLHSKCGAIPALRYIEEPITLPHPNPTTEAEISANIGHLNTLLAAGTLDVDFFNALMVGQHQHINALKAREDVPANTNITITGGLPSLPGTNITMPELPTMNGNQHIISPPEARLLPDIDPDQGPVIPPEQDQNDVTRE
jgi:hypothetical protein